ncbi:MAG: tetratricopeptide repeat protein [Bacteroidales bacterium]|nr:tetratricopeptide repeat protein [Bacteroidales bacterium]
MKKVLTVILLSLCCTVCLAQRGDLRKGNRHFAKGEYQEADISYRKGLLKDSSDVAAKYNLANTLYREGNYDEAKKLLTYDYQAIKDNPHAADIYFNLGNTAISQEDWNAAVEAYSKCLMINPDDIQAKENYTYARYHLQNQDQNQDGDGENNQDQNNDQQNQDQQDQNKDQKDQNQQQQQQPAELSPQQAQQLLQAIQEKERETQEKVDKEKAAVLQSRQKEKNW